MYRLIRYALLLLSLSLLAGCLPERPAPVLKIGLLAPFEGERREVGYHLLPAIRAATPSQVQGRRVEWVILDSRGDSEFARERARELLADPTVLAIVGPVLPEEVAAVAPVVQEAGIGWWPLAPEGEAGLDEWRGTAGEALDANLRWGALAWPALRRAEATMYLDPALTSDSGDFASVGGENPWPLDWLAWQGAMKAFEAMEGAARLDRPTVLAGATPLDFPPPHLYRSENGAFPGKAVVE